MIKTDRIFLLGVYLLMGMGLWLFGIASGQITCFESAIVAYVATMTLVVGFWCVFSGIRRDIK